jgi:hypothetical protein
MPSPDRMLTTLRHALVAIRAVSGRQGHRLLLTECDEILVAGDLHGHVGNMQAILRLANLAENPGRHLVLQELIHSPFRYPEGGDKSHQLVDLFAALKCQFPNRVHYLPGNHELAQWTNRPIVKGAVSYNELFREGVETAYRHAASEIYRLYLQIFRACPLVLQTANGIFLSHSLPPRKWLDSWSVERLTEESYDETDLQPGGFVYSLLWGRDVDDEHVAEFLRRVGAAWLVTGHIPTEGGYLVPNGRQVIVDCSDCPAAVLRIPANRPLNSIEEFHAGIIIL